MDMTGVWAIDLETIVCVVVVISRKGEAVLSDD